MQMRRYKIFKSSYLKLTGLILTVSCVVIVATVWFFSIRSADEEMKMVKSRSLEAETFVLQHSCEVQPFRLELTKGKTIEFNLTLQSDPDAQVSNVRLGNLPKDVTGTLQPVGSQSERVVRLSAGTHAQRGSFSIPINFTEEVNGKSGTTRCQFNLVIK
jgi:hypothetical protein